MVYNPSETFYQITCTVMKVNTKNYIFEWNTLSSKRLKSPPKASHFLFLVEADVEVSIKLQ